MSTAIASLSAVAALGCSVGAGYVTVLAQERDVGLAPFLVLFYLTASLFLAAIIFVCDAVNVT